jgi:hypothetical protein
MTSPFPLAHDPRLSRRTVVAALAACGLATALADSSRAGTQATPAGPPPTMERPALGDVVSLFYPNPREAIVEVQVTDLLVDPRRFALVFADGRTSVAGVGYVPDLGVGELLPAMTLGVGETTAGLVWFRAPPDATVAGALLTTPYLVHRVIFATDGFPSAMDGGPWAYGTRYGHPSLEFEVTRFRDPSPLPSPRDGYRIVEMDVLARNVGEETHVTVAPYQFDVLSPEGDSYTTYASPDLPDDAEMGVADLDPGQEHGGTLSFLLPDRFRAWDLVYHYDERMTVIGDVQALATGG